MPSLQSGINFPRKTLTSAAPFSTLVAFILLTAFVVWHARLFLKAGDGGARVIGLMFAIVQRAGQHQPAGGERFSFPRTIVTVDGEQNGQVTLPATNAEIPSGVGFGPARNIQRISPPLRKHGVCAILIHLVVMSSYMRIRALVGLIGMEEKQSGNESQKTS